MDTKKEQAVVGLFVIVVIVILIVTIFLMTGGLNKGNISYRAYFNNAGGLQPGSQVRFAGGPAVGRVEKVASDPHDTTRMEVDFSLRGDVPVKTDSLAEITSLSPLSDNFLGIRPGNAASPRAPAGSTLRSVEYSSLADIADLLGQLAPSAHRLMDNLNGRTTQLQATLDRVNDVLNARNRANISESLSSVNGMLRENRTQIHSTITHLDESSAKLGSLIDDFRKTSRQADDALAHLDAVVSENRPDLHQSIQELRKTLASATSLTDQLNYTVDANTVNLDQIIDNLQQATQNLDEFTDTIKTRPYTLLRSSEAKPHKPGEPPPK
jgi:phospholipid/cholesterol/gamma-HCH transport system substrate-binding protein